MASDDPEAGTTSSTAPEGEERKQDSYFSWPWLRKLNAFTDQPLGGIIMRGVFQIFVFGVFLSYVDAIISARAEVKDAASAKRAEVLALKEDLLSAANTYRNAAQRAQKALTNLRFERFRSTMSIAYPRSRETWLALEPIALQRWAAIHGKDSILSLCPEIEGTNISEEKSPGCTAIRAWLGGLGSLHHRTSAGGTVSGTWSVRRRFHIVNAILTGDGKGRVAPDRTEWVQCREAADAVFAARRQSCLDATASAQAQHQCISEADAALASFQETHCLSSKTKGGRLRGHVYCLLASQPGDICRGIVGMDGFTETNRPNPTPQDQEALDKDEVLRDNRLTMQDHALKFPDDPINLADAISDAVRLTDLAAEALAQETCRSRRAANAAIVRWFIPLCTSQAEGAGT